MQELDNKFSKHNKYATVLWCICALFVLCSCMFSMVCFCVSSIHDVGIFWYHIYTSLDWWRILHMHAGDWDHLRWCHDDLWHALFRVVSYSADCTVRVLYYIVLKFLAFCCDAISNVCCVLQTHLYTSTISKLCVLVSCPCSRKWWLVPVWHNILAQLCLLPQAYRFLTPFTTGSVISPFGSRCAVDRHRGKRHLRISHSFDMHRSLAVPCGPLVSLYLSFLFGDTLIPTRFLPLFKVLSLLLAGSRMTLTLQQKQNVSMMEALRM